MRRIEKLENRVSELERVIQDLRSVMSPATRLARVYSEALPQDQPVKPPDAFMSFLRKKGFTPRSERPSEQALPPE